MVSRIVVETFSIDLAEEPSMNATEDARTGLRPGVENPEECVKAGGNVFYAVPTEIDGDVREGCAREERSCIAALGIVGEEVPYDSADPFITITNVAPGLCGRAPRAPSAGRGYHGEELSVGDPLGPVAVVAATLPTEVMGVPILKVLAATTAQGVAAVRAIPGLVQNVQERMPHLVELNTPPDPADGLRWRGAPDDPESVAPVPVVPKGDYGIADRYERFLSLTGMSPDEEWLWPPATDAEVAAEERTLGHALPGDLAELLQVHNGECLFDSHQWLGCSDGKRMAQQSSWFNHELIVELRSNPSLAVDPGPRTLYAATNSQVGILYDMDEVPGRLLYLDVLSPCPGRPAVPGSHHPHRLLPGTGRGGPHQPHADRSRGWPEHRALAGGGHGRGP